MIKRIKKYIEQVKEKRFLKKHNVKSWEQYHRVYDPDINKNEMIVENYYHGYDTVIIMSKYENVGDIFGTYPKVANIEKWCKENANYKYRIDLSPIFYANGKLSFIDNWGVEEIILAFKNNEDFLLFMLTYDGIELKGRTDVVKIN